MRPWLPAALAALLAGCTTAYSLTLMPRDSGKLYQGEATSPSGGDEAHVTVTIGERRYDGTWVVSQPPPATGVSVGGMFGGHFSTMGTSIVVDAQRGDEAKALLRSADGHGLRCDFRGVSGSAGTGSCTDDDGLVYDVQLRRK